MKLILVFGFIILASVLVAEAKDINDEDVVVKDRTIRAAQNNGIGKNERKMKTKGNGGNEIKTKKRQKKQFKKNRKINSGKRKNKNVKQNSKKAKNKKRGNKFSQKDKKMIRKEKINKKKKLKQKKIKKMRKQKQSCDADKSVTTACMESVVQSMSFLQKQVTNFLNQYKRIQGFNKTISNKLAKNNVFGSATGYLLTALGGDIKNISCGDSGTNDTSKASAALQTYNILVNCNKSIISDCSMPSDLVPSDVIEKFDEYCTNQYTLAKTKADECRTEFTKNGTAACDCWNEVSQIITNVKTSGECSASDYSKAVRKFKETCVETFSNCRKQEDASVELVYQCGSGEVISTATTSS